MLPPPNSPPRDRCPWRRSLAVSLVFALGGCGNSEEGSVPKLPPRAEVEKNLATPFLKEGAKVRTSQQGGIKE